MATIQMEPNPSLGDECWLLVGERGQEYGSVERIDSSGLYIVEWGSGYGWRRRFRAIPDLIQFINEHADAIADGEEV